VRHLRWIGLVSSLLIVGVLAGLMAPLPSEAVPTVTVQFDGVVVSPSILITSTCTSTEVTLGYTACYAIRTGTTQYAGSLTRKFMIQNAPGATARLRVADKLGQDKFSLIGVQFVPVLTNWGSATANTNEQHVLTITMANTFDSAVNIANSGTYVYAMRAGGEFRAGPSPTTAPTACLGTGGTTTGRCDTIGDSVTYPGKGTFSPTLQNVDILRPAGSTNNTQPLKFTVAGPTASIVSFDGLTNTTLGQVNPTYPSFICDQDGSMGGVVCKPTITQTMTVTLKGPDSFVLVNGQDTFAADCATQLSDKQEQQIAFLKKIVKFLNWLEGQRPDPRLSAFIDKIEAFLATITSNPDPDCPGATLVNLDIAIAAANDQVAFLADGAVPAEPAPETGTITVSFAPATNFGVGPNPYSVAIGDLNRDGKLDLAVANGTSTVTVLLGTGTGAFGGATAFAVGHTPTSVAIGDLNGDGIPDLAAANSSSNTVSVLLGTGTGAFGANMDFAAEITPYSVAIGDLNRDGIPDLAVANYGSATVSVLVGTGGGAFGPATNFAVGTNPSAVAIGDLNRDGIPDLAVANNASNTVSVLLGTGTGAFGVATNFAVGVTPVAVAIGDLNGDLTPDLVTGNFSHTVSVLLGSTITPGTFGAATNVAEGTDTNPSSVAIGDLNRDGTPDLAVANGGNATVSVLVGTGGGAFGPATNFAVGTNPSSVAIGDLNNDGKLDLAVVNRNGPSVSILLADD
jgi:VCBS repeat protein/FG-GAP repeat protein